jgi:hypothetical protein
MSKPSLDSSKKQAAKGQAFCGFLDWLSLRCWTCRPYLQWPSTELHVPAFQKIVTAVRITSTTLWIFGPFLVTGLQCLSRSDSALTSDIAVPVIDSRMHRRIVMIYSRTYVIRSTKTSTIYGNVSVKHVFLVRYYTSLSVSTQCIATDLLKLSPALRNRV